MADFPHADPQTASLENRSRRKRGVVKLGILFLVLAGAGSAAAFHFLKKDTPPPPAVKYETPDADKAQQKAQEAASQTKKNEKALEAARETFRDVQAEWEAAKAAKEQAEQNAESAKADKIAEAKKALEIAEQQFAAASQKLEEAKAQLKTAENKLKTAEELEAEAKAERERVEKMLAQQEAYRQELLGKWQRSDYYGELTLELKEHGKAMMTIDFNTATAFFVGSNKLELDIEWEVANGDHLLFNSIGGRPEKAFHYVTVTQNKGRHRDEVVTHLDEKSFSTHDANNKKKVRTWKRVANP